MNINDKLLGSLIGLAVGDAVGTTVEFRQRDTFEPVTDMRGGGPFSLPPGYWTDDTSMALCLADSLIHDPQLSKFDLLSRFSDWYREGYNSSTGRCFDIGTTTRAAIREFESTCSTVNNTHFMDAGNGSIMRLSPAVIKHYRDPELAVRIAILQGETTHGATECIDSCELLAKLILNALSATDKQSVFDVELDTVVSPRVSDCLNRLTVVRDDVKSSGYVIDTIHAAMWCFYNTDSFEEAVLKAVNLGDDADTVGAVTGQIAGAYYGLSGIPASWTSKLYDKDRIIALGETLINE